MKDIQQAIRFDLSAQEFDQAMVRLLRQQHGRNPVYRRYAETLGFDPGSAGHWLDFPPLPVEAFKQAEPVACFDPVAARAVFETSGTTGSATGRHYLEDTRLYEHSLEAAFLHFMPDLRRHLWISLIPPASALPCSSLSHMISRLSGRIPQDPAEWVMHPAFTCDTSARRNVFLKAQEKAAAVFSTVFALVQALDADAAEEKFWKLSPQSVLFLTGGSKGRVRDLAPEALEAWIEERLGISADRVFFEYGMTELSSQGYVQGFSMTYTFPPWVRVVARDPISGGICRPGTDGLLEFYDLANTGSIATVRTRDVGRVFTGPGDPFSRALLLGRAPAAPARGCSLPYET